MELPVWETGLRVFSQYDEDGVILFLLAVLGTGTRRFVDLGAADGLRASNTANLALNFGFDGVFVESRGSDVADGVRFYESHPDTSASPPRFVCDWITRENVNALVSGAGFTAVDWEGAVRHGLPLWDLVYFLAHAMIVLERVAADAAPAAIADLFAGRSPGSPHALAWVRRMVEALAIPRELVGPLALTSWLHHGLSAEQRTAAVRREGGEPSGGLTRLPRLVAERWLADPALGARWSAWA